MDELWAWWYDWGAIIFLVTAIFIASLVLFDTMRRKAGAGGWQIGVILAPVLLLPSLVLKTQVQPGGPIFNTGDTVNTGWVLLVLGTLAGVTTVVIAIGYFMTASSAPARRPVIVGGPPGGGTPIWAKNNDPYPPSRPPAGPTRHDGGGGAPVAVPPRAPKPKTNASVYLRNGPAGPREHRLNVGRTTFGRALECDIMIDDPDVSRDHAHIQEQYGRFALGDHGSTHGTYVNGNRIRGEVYLEDGDELRLGPTIQLVFKSFA